MSKRKSTGFKRFQAENLSGWDIPIAEAKQRIQDLEFSVRVFERKKAAGESYPATNLQSDSELIGLATAPAKG